MDVWRYMGLLIIVVVNILVYIILISFVVIPFICRRVFIHLCQHEPAAGLQRLRSLCVNIMISVSNSDSTKEMSVLCALVASHWPAALECM